MQVPRSRKPVKNLQNALRELTDKPFCRTSRYRGQQVRADREGVYRRPDGFAPILEFEGAFVRDCRRRGIPVFAHCVMRTAQEQQAMFDRGVTKARPGQSAHEYGMAVDIIHSVHGWAISKESWRILGHIGCEVAARIGVKVEWGGEWDFYDPAHWQLKGWREIVREVANWRGQEK